MREPRPAARGARRTRGRWVGEGVGSNRYLANSHSGGVASNFMQLAAETGCMESPAGDDEPPPIALVDGACAAGAAASSVVAHPASAKAMPARAIPNVNLSAIEHLRKPRQRGAARIVGGARCSSDRMLRGVPP